MKREDVERFEPEGITNCRFGTAYMEPCQEGDWVRYSDYTALLARAEKAEAALAAQQTDTRAQAIAGGGPLPPLL